MNFTIIKNNITILLIISSFALNACGNTVDSRKVSPDPKERVKKNMEEGRGFRLMDTINKSGGNGNFQFASSNEYGELL